MNSFFNLFNQLYWYLYAEALFREYRIVVFIFSILFAVLSSYVAKTKHRNQIAWFFIGFCIGIFGLIVIGVVPDLENYKTDNKNPQKTNYIAVKECPECKELINRDATVCKYCGNTFANINQNYNATVNSYTGSYWTCSKCGCSNQDNYNWCKDCNSPRYTMDSISDREKEILVEYIQKQLEISSFDESKNFQKTYFETSSLKFMTLMLPDVNSFDDLNAYKEKLREIISESEVNKVDSNQQVLNEQNDDLEYELEKLKILFGKQLITEDEYKAKKSKLLEL